MRVVALALLVTSLLLSGPSMAVAQEQPPIVRQSENLTLVEHRFYEAGSDMHFQRREGSHLLDGTSTSGSRDYLFAGTDSSASTSQPADGVGVRILDVTDPQAIEPVASILCTGYHSDVAVYEDLLVQTIDDPASNGGCDPSFDPEGIDRSGEAGIRIFDIADPARPYVVGFVGDEEVGGKIHNATVIPWAGLVYLATNDLPQGVNQGGPVSRFPIVDLEAEGFPATVLAMSDIVSGVADPASCHDIGLDPARKLAFCAAVQQTFVLDVSDPFQPDHVSTIVNPAVNIHHGARLAPDGTTLVVNDEMGGAIGGFGCLGQGSGGQAGALWFYDLSDPSSPTLEGSFSTTELAPGRNFCTSHFYNFIVGTELLVVGWYRSGMFVIDYADPSSPQEHAAFQPEGANYWAAYHWHGALYGNAFGSAGGGLWVLTLDGLGDREPAPPDEGTSWARWTPPESPAETEPDPAPATQEPPPPAAAPLPTTGAGAPLVAIALLGLGWTVSRRARRANG